MKHNHKNNQLKNYLNYKLMMNKFLKMLKIITLININLEYYLINIMMNKKNKIIIILI